MKNNVIILAAGKGTRMKSDFPKACHKVLDKEMIIYITELFNDYNKNIVVGYKKEKIMNLAKDCNFIEQKEQNGTGHAVKCVSDLKGKSGVTFVINGDLPFVTNETVSNMLKHFEDTKSSLTILTTVKDDPSGFGRILKENDLIKSIKEEKDASNEEKQIKEVNVGLYCFDNKLLFEYLENINSNNKQNELYLTDVLKLMIDDNKIVTSFTCNNIESMSANSKLELSNMEEEKRIDIIKKHLENGVQISNINSVTIGPDVLIESGVIIKDFTHVMGKVEIKKGSSIGPFARIRQQALIEENCIIGNFVEIKNSKIGRNVKISHHAYIGDSVIGDNTNIGSGVITCNYDGVNKNQTIIGKNVFVGSNVNLIAPITIDDNAFIAAGTTVSKDIEHNSFVVERSELKIKRRR